MSRTTLYTILYICVLAIPVYAQQDKGVFSDETYDSYSRAFELNEAKDYLAAYRCALCADQALSASLSKNHLDASALSDDLYRYPYWAVKKTKAEIAYMLGIYTDMETVSRELRSSLARKQWETDAVKETRDALLASIEKIDGSRFYLTEKYDSAEISLKRALLLGDFDGNDAFVCKVHDDLAQIYYKQAKYDKALAHLDTILVSPLYKNGSRNKETEQNIKTVQSQRAICLARLGRYAEALKEIESIVRFFKAAGNKRLYAEALRKKAKVLMLQYDATGKYSSGAVACYRRYLSVSKDYIDNHLVDMSESEREQYWMAEQPFVCDCFRLEDKSPELLYDVALYSKALLLQMGRDFKEGMTPTEKKNSLASIRVDWQQVKEKMPAYGCAIEFVIYEKHEVNHIGALVLNKKSASPKFVDLGEVTSISDYPLIARLSVKDVFADTQNRDNINTLYNDTTLKTLIWNDEIVNAIGDSKDVYFSPDGILHQMAIEYMTPRALDGKRFYRLTTTRLLTQANHKLETDKMLVCGGVEYGASVDDFEKGNDQLAYSLIASMDLTVSKIPYSAVEIDSISAIRKAHSDDMVLRADSLTEFALTQLMGKYHITHISTHGLFSEVAKIGTDIHPSSTDTQLSKSCLFLSGSAKNLKQKGFDTSQHDGILSAREIAKMDLKDVDLTVLSACMSGLGFITPDGVYGLQRGLKTAGVKAIVSTLWSVDDEASCFFIVELYKNLEAGMDLYTAFWAARETLRKYEITYGEQSASKDASGANTKSQSFTIQRFNKPYFYNAFILIDGIQ